MGYLPLWIFLYWLVSAYTMWIMVPESDIVAAIMCIFMGWLFVPARLISKIIK